MRSPGMEQSNAKDDPLSRIQREIIEVTERENEFRKIHPTYSRNLSESDASHKNMNGHTNGNGYTNGNTHKITRAISTSQLMTVISPAPPKQNLPQPNLINGNGFTRRYTPNNAQKGIMQRFIASKGKLSVAPLAPVNGSISKQPYIPHHAVVAPPVISKLPEGKPIRKGFVPVEEKIQKELKDLKDRESELKKQRKMTNTYQLDFSSLNLSDREDEAEQSEEDDEDDDDIPAPGKLRIAKSIGELYEAMNEGRSPSPTTQMNGHDSFGSMKPAKSLAELCELGPGEEPLAPRSTVLIAKWESIIQKKQEANHV